MEQLLSKIYFGTDIKKKDTNSINFFKANPYLTLEPDTSSMVLSVTGEATGPKYYDFVFFSHPYFSWKFTNGALQVTTKNMELDEVITDVSVAFEFETKLTFDSAYADIKKQLAKYASKHFKMKIPQPMEVINYKFAPTNHNIILVKGIKGKLFYFYIVLNKRE